MKNHISALMVIAVMAATVVLPSCNFSLKVGSGNNDSIADSIASTDTLWNDRVLRLKRSSTIFHNMD